MCLNENCEWYKQNKLTTKEADLLTEIFKHKNGKVGREQLGFTDQDETKLYDKILFAFDDLKE
jgi:hypothetical protein